MLDWHLPVIAPRLWPTGRHFHQTPNPPGLPGGRAIYSPDISFHVIGCRELVQGGGLARTDFPANRVGRLEALHKSW